MSGYTGGPAFPVPGLHEDESFNGVTLRDYFAAKAMQSILALGEAYDYEGDTPIKQLPGIAYALADAMLAERAK